MPNTTNTRTDGGAGLRDDRDDRNEMLSRIDLPAYIHGQYPPCRMKCDGDDHAKCAATWRDGDDPEKVHFDRKDRVWRWFDHKTKEGGTVIDFLTKVQGLGMGAAMERARELAGMARAVPMARPQDTAWWVYVDEFGAAVNRVVRFEPGPDGKPKGYRQEAADGAGGWRKGPGCMKGVRRVPYRLPELPQADLVYVVEGEKCADRLYSDGLVATCNAMGAEKWTREHAKYLVGKHVVVLGDNDDPGRKHVAQVVATLQGVAASIKVPTLEGLAEKGDIVDWLNAGRTIDDLRALVDATPEHNPASEQGEPKPGPTRFKTISAAELAVMTFPEPKWAIPDLLPEGLTILGGKPKIGKSWMALGIAQAVALGGHALGRHKVEAGDVLYLGCEDTRRRLASRLKDMRDPGEQPPTRLHAVTAGDIPTMSEGGMNLVKQWLDDHPAARLIVIDTLARFRGGKRGRGQNAYEADVEALSPLQELAASRGVAILVVTHLRKAEDSEDPQDLISGSLGQAGTADASWVLQRARHGAYATLFMTGRDIEEKKLGLSFDRITKAWNILGNAEEVAVTKERGELVTYLRENPGSTPSEIAAALYGGKDKKNKAWNALKRLEKDDLAHPGEKGKWSLIDRIDANMGVPRVRRVPDVPEPQEHALLLDLNLSNPYTHGETPDVYDVYEDGGTRGTPRTSRTRGTPRTRENEKIESDIPPGHVPGQLPLLKDDELAV